MWCSATLWCSGAAAWATATTKHRSKKSSSGVETRNGSSADRPTIGVRNRRFGCSDIAGPPPGRLGAVDQIPAEQRERRLLGGARPAVGSQRRGVVDLGADPHAVAAVAPGD